MGRRRKTTYQARLDKMTPEEQKTYREERRLAVAAYRERLRKSGARINNMADKLDQKALVLGMSELASAIARNDAFKEAIRAEVERQFMALIRGLAEQEKVAKRG